jgi:gliding motility-associated-like protein
VVTLDLTIRPSYHTTIEETACNEYTWEGETYIESGEYTRQFTSADGCDSTLTLLLSIGHPSESELWETSCGPYHWENETFSESGDYTREFQSSHECDSLVTLHLTVLDTTLVTSNSNPDFCNTGETVLSVTGNFDTYVWNTGEVATTIIVNRSGYYSVTASNEACERTAHLEVPQCIPNLLLPNAITPSRNDGHNDVLALSEYDRSQISEFSIAIYNRWGGLTFWSNDKYFQWDGTKDGKLEVGTVYNYVIQYADHNGKHYRITGSVTVL